MPANIDKASLRMIENERAYLDALKKFTADELAAMDVVKNLGKKGYTNFQFPGF